MQQQQQMRNQQQQHYGGYGGAQVQPVAAGGGGSSGYGGASPVTTNPATAGANARMNYPVDSTYPAVEQQNYGAYKGSGGNHGRADRSYRPY